MVPKTLTTDTNRRISFPSMGQVRISCLKLDGNIGDTLITAVKYSEAVAKFN